MWWCSVWLQTTKDGRWDVRWFSKKKQPEECTLSVVPTVRHTAVARVLRFVSGAVLCCAVLCCAVLYCAVLCCAVLCGAVLCCAVLRCAVLCCAVQFHHDLARFLSGWQGMKLLLGQSTEVFRQKKHVDAFGNRYIAHHLFCYSLEYWWCVPVCTGGAYVLVVCVSAPALHLTMGFAHCSGLASRCRWCAPRVRWIWCCLPSTTSASSASSTTCCARRRRPPPPIPLQFALLPAPPCRRLRAVLLVLVLVIVLVLVLAVVALTSLRERYRPPRRCCRCRRALL